MSDIEGLSILIPIYNFDIRLLVEKLSKEVSSLNIPCEIRCYDDGSFPSFKKENVSVSEIKYVVYEELPENIGRSRIRNKLAREAKYPILLFLDSDSTLVGEDFIQNYLKRWQKDSVISGGTIYADQNDPSYALRYYYGKKREEKTPDQRKKNPYGHINLNNLFLSKKIYLENQLDETIKTYGHEDTKFAEQLRKKAIPVIHIQNPVMHSGLETNEAFLQKSREAIKNFNKIIAEGYGHHSGLYRTYHFLRRFYLKGTFLLFYKIFESGIEKNLLSEHPSIFYFDLYKLKLLLEE